MTESPSDILDDAHALRLTERPEATPADSLARSAGRGAMWQFVGAGWQTVVQLGASAVLARLLFPDDFGIMGMAILAQGLVKRTGDFSAASGVIAKKDVTQDDLSTAFWMSFGVQAVLCVVTFAIAPLAAWFFGAPEVTGVIRALSVTFLLTGVGAVSGTLLRKRLVFGAPKIIEGAAFTLQSGLAILFALVFDMDYWALVISMLIANFAQTCAIVLYARWLPRFRFNPASFRYLFRYGANGLGTSLVGYFHNNTDYLLVGKLLGPSMLGLYEFAYRIPHMAFNRFAMPMRRVTFPVLSTVQTEDQRLAAGYVKVAKYIAIILFPALGGLAAVAGPAVAVLWGEKWLPVVVPLQILCFRSAIQSVISPVRDVFLCKDRPDIPFKYGVCTLVFTCGAVVGLGYAFGLVGVASGMLISVMPSLVLLWLAFRLTKTPLKRLFAALAPAATSATVSSLLALGAVHWTTLSGGGNPLALGLGVSTGAAAYLAIMWLRFGDTAREVIRTIRVISARSPKEPLVSRGG